MGQSRRRGRAERLGANEHEPHEAASGLALHGEVASLSASAISISEHSPNLAGYAVGDPVAISCVDGTLTAIERLETNG